MPVDKGGGGGGDGHFNMAQSLYTDSVLEARHFEEQCPNVCRVEGKST